MANEVTLSHLTNLEFVKHYLKESWHLIPVYGIVNGQCACGHSECRTPGKHPASKNGIKDASLSHESLDKWAFADPPYNIGIATGQKSGLVVLDVDTRNGGDKTLADLEAKYGKLPPTKTVITGSGGRHYYFKYPDGVTKIKSVAGALGQGLDIKADGGYVIAPPSRHISGDIYRWEDETFDYPLAELPKWLLSLIITEQPSPNGHKLYKDVLNGKEIPEGQRNNTLTSLAGKLRQAEFGIEHVVRLLMAVNATLCKPPLPDEEVIRIAESVCRYPIGNKDDDDLDYGADEEIATPLEWEWENWIPRGEVTMIVGDTGVGKSWFAAYLIAAHLGVKPYPTTKDILQSDPNRKVLLLETEQFRETYSNRMKMLGIDLSRIRFLKSPDPDIPEKYYIPDLIKDFDRIKTLIEKKGITMLVVDSLTGSHSLDENSNVMVKAMKNLTTLAEAYNISVLVVHHTRKKGMLDSDHFTLDRVRGHSSIVQFCRSVIVLEKINLEDQEDQETIVRIQQIKNNHTKLQKPFGMIISEDDDIRFTDAPPGNPIEKRNKSIQAKEFLKSELATGGKTPQELLHKAKELRISRATLYNARDELNVLSHRGKWYLPDKIMGGNVPDEEPH